MLKTACFQAICNLLDSFLEETEENCFLVQVNAETQLAVGDAKKAICDAVQKLNVDLLVLGDHGDGKLKR